MEVGAVIEIMAVGTLAGAVGSNTQFVLLTAARPNVNSALAAISLAFLVGLLAAMTYKWGIIGAAIAFSLASTAVLPVHFLVLKRTIGLDLAEIWPRIWRSLVGTLAMMLALWLLAPSMASATFWQALIKISLAGAIGGITYTATVLALWKFAGEPEGVEHLLIRAAKDIFGRISTRLLGARSSSGT